MHLRQNIFHLYFSLLKPYRKASPVLRRKAKAQISLLIIFTLAGFFYIVLSFLFLGMNRDVFQVMINVVLLLVSLTLLYKGHYDISVLMLLIQLSLIMPLTAFFSVNHEPIKLYNVAIYGIIGLLVAGLTAEHIYNNIIVGVFSVLTLVVYFYFFVIPAELKPFSLMIDALIASSVLVSLSTLISIFLTLQLNSLFGDLMASNRDLDRKVAERSRQLEISQTHLIEAEKLSALGGMISGISHEINTPLGSSILASSHLRIIRGDLQKMVEADSVSNNEILEYLGKSDELGRLQEDNLSRLKTLIESFQQISVDTQQKEPQLVDIKEELEMTLRIFRKKIESTSGIQVKAGFFPELKIVTYPNLIWQIITHLLENSFYHAFPSGDGSIELSHEMAGNDLILHYRDDGIGLDEEIRKKIFEPFFTTSRGNGRTGLGMITVYNRINNAGGTITVSSVPGEGTEFNIRLPDLSHSNEV